MVGSDPKQPEFDAGESREDHLDLDLGDADGATANRPAEGARVVTPDSAPAFEPGKGADFLDLDGGEGAGGDDLYSELKKAPEGLDLDEDVPDEPEPEPEPEPAVEPVAAEPPAPAANELGLDLDLPDAEPAVAAAPALYDGAADPATDGAQEPVADAGVAADEPPTGDLGDLEISDEVPEGTYERPEEAEGTAEVEAPVAIGDEAEDDGVFAEDELEIDFDAPAERIGVPRGAIVGAAVAGALLTAGLAIVDPGEEVVVPPVAPRAIENTAVAMADSEPVEVATDNVEGETDDSAAFETEPAPSAEDVPATFEDTVDAEPFTGFETELASLFGELPGSDLVAPEAGPLGPPTLTGEGLSTAPGPIIAGVMDDAALLDNDIRRVEDRLLAQANVPEDNSGLRFVTQDDLDEIWLGTELPPRGVEARRNRLTPHVGNVRLTTDLGEVFEGQLYSIGGGEVSLSTHLGRITFESKQVGEVQRLSSTAALDGDNSALPGERVRVSTAGGWIQGRLLSRDGAKVTVITESGGRITLEGAEVQPVGVRSNGAFLGRTGD